MPIKIHNKDYWTVAERVDLFRADYQDFTIMTELVSADADTVVFKATIADTELRVIATGYAEENRHGSAINKTSALEIAETSAVGRALAFYGLAGTEIASADEVAGAISQQAAQELIEYNALVREFWPSVNAAKDYLEPKWGENENQSNVTDARACLKELGEDIHRKLWRAPTKGGCFTTNERKLLKEPTEECI